MLYFKRVFVEKRDIFHLVWRAVFVPFRLFFPGTFASWLCSLNYSIVRRRLLKARGERVVLFLVSEPAKWKLQSVVDELKRFDRIKALFAITIADQDWSLPLAARAKKIAFMRRYFSERGLPVVDAYDSENGEAIDIKRYRPDLVVYQHPWHWHETHSPIKVSRYALTYYIPYFVPTFVDFRQHAETYFHRRIFRQTALNAQFRRFYQEEASRRGVRFAGEWIAVGHPMIDNLNSQMKNVHNGSVVIYAPHWSISHPSNPNPFGLSTFCWSGELMLSFAKRHPEVRWAFKPHPTLRIVLERIGGTSYADWYYGEWERIAECCYDGGYVDLFKRSRALITDCDSFLSEYAITGCPIVHLVGSGFRGRGYTPFKSLFDTYYQIDSQVDFEAILADVVLRGNDFRKGERMRCCKESGLLSANATDGVVTDMRSVLGL